MTRDSLLRRTLLILPLLVPGGCGDDDPPPAVAPPAAVTIAAVRVNPPLSVLRAAPEVLVMADDSVRLDTELGQDFMPGDDWGSEGGGGPGRFVTGSVIPRPETAGVTITDAWILLDGRAEPMRPSAWPGTGLRPPRFDAMHSAHALPRLDTIDVVVRLRTALDDARYLQRRGVLVTIYE